MVRAGGAGTAVPATVWARGGANQLSEPEKDLYPSQIDQAASGLCMSMTTFLNSYNLLMLLN